MIFVILQAPNDGYYWLIKAGSNKHFELEDNGFSEVTSGEYYDMLELMEALEGQPGDIKLKSENGGYSYHSEEELHYIIEMCPDFLNDKEFV